MNLPRITRDLVLFAAGLGLTINEAVLRQGPERPTLLALYAGMMGLPAILKADAFRRQATGDPDEAEAEATRKAVEAERRLRDR